MPCAATLKRVSEGSALDHIELTYHDVTVFAIPEFKSLEVLEKNIFALILLSINPKTNPNPNPDPNYKEKNLENKNLYKSITNIHRRVWNPKLRRGRPGAGCSKPV